MTSMKTDLIDNRQIRIFISSTFRDMQDERNQLMRFTFPKLRDLAAKRDVTLTEVDLRWGITDEDSKSGKVVDICLREIENSIPFFIGIIGNRYGWVPKKKDLDDNVTDHFPSVNGYLANNLSVTEMEMQFGVLEREEDMHACFYIKDFEDNRTQGLEKEPQDSLQKLEQLKQAVKESRYPSATYSSIEDLSRQVEEAFIRLLDQLFPKGNLSEFEKEQIGQRSFLNQLCQNYICDEMNFQILDEWSDDWNASQMVVSGASGLGKSALIANWLKKTFANEKHEYNIVYHFVGNGGSKSSCENIAKYLCEGIRICYNWHASENKNDIQELKALFERIGDDSSKPLLIVLDGINQIIDADNAKLLNWLPTPSNNIKLLFSTLEEDLTYTVFKNRNYQIHTLQALSIGQREKLVVSYLHDVYAKSLTPERVSRIVNDTQCANTLVLRTLLDELVTFGIHEKLDEKIDFYLSHDSVEDFYQSFLMSYEEDFGKEFVTDLLSIIVLSKNGLTETEILGILNYGVSNEEVKVTPLLWSRFYCSFLRNFVSRNGVISYSHQYINNAVTFRYLKKDNESRLRRQIVDYCYNAKSSRIYSEAAHQLYKLEKWQELYKAICYLNVFYELYNSDKTALTNYWVGLLIADKEKFTPIIYISESTKVVPKRFLATLLNELLIFISRNLNSPLIALECTTTVLEKISTVYGTKTKEMADVYNSLGGILYDLKRYKEALGYLEKSFDIKKELGLTQTESAALSYNNMGYAYRKIGDKKKAFELYRKAAELRKSLFGENSLPYADSCFAIGSLFMDSSKNDSAEKLLRKSLKLYITHRGEVSNRTADCYGNLGILYSSIQDYKSAIEFHTKALTIRKKMYGELHLDVAGGYRNIGNTYSRSGDYSKALEMLFKAVEIQIAIQGENAISLISTYNNLGATYDSMQDYLNAIDYYQKALVICEANFGENSYTTAECLNNLAVTYLSMNDNQKALDCLQKVLSCWQKQYHPTHKRIGLCCINIGCALYKLGRKAESHDSFQKAYDILKSLGEDDENVLLCRKYLGYF